MTPERMGSIETLGWGLLLEHSAKGVVLLLLALAVVRTWSRASAAQRHAVWLLALGSLLVLPVVSAVGPRWHLPLPAMETGEVLPLAVAPPEPAPPGDPSLATAVVAPSAGPALGWRAVLLAVWAAGFLALAARLALDVVRARRLVRSARPVTEGPLPRSLDALRRRLGIARRPPLLELPARAMPATCGLLRPVVLLPADAAGWPAVRLEAVLLHELAHVRRRDVLARAGTYLVGAVYWFIPLVWRAIRELELESERACDDLVLRHGLENTTYAEQLLALARSTRRPLAAALASSPAVSRSQLQLRIHSLLVDRARRGEVSRRARALLLAAGGVASAAVAMASPAPRVLEASASSVAEVAASAWPIARLDERLAPASSPASIVRPVRPDTPGRGEIAPETAVAGGLAALGEGLETGVVDDARFYRYRATVQRAARAAELHPVVRARMVPVREAPAQRGDLSRRRGASRPLVVYQRGRVPAECVEVGMIVRLDAGGYPVYRSTRRWEVETLGGNAIVEGMSHDVVLRCG